MRTKKEPTSVLKSFGMTYKMDEALKRESDESHITQSEIIRLAIQRYLDAQFEKQQGDIR